MLIRRYFGIKRAVNELIRLGRLKEDRGQAEAVDYLCKLSHCLEEPAKQPFWDIFGFYNKVPKGVYVYGSVGSGKTMVMDLFYDNVRIEAKSRLHFNSFMLNYHEKVKALSESGSKDALLDFVNEEASRTRLLCLDEFQVLDIADAMILRRLLENFFKKHVTIVTTSNRHPDELYKNGIQRSSFVPCIELIKSSMKLINFSSETDYRANSKSDGNERFLTPINDETTALMQDRFRKVCPNASSNLKLKVMGRNVDIVLGCEREAATFTFKELVMDAKSAADYIAIAQSFPVVFLTEFPALGLDSRNELRRFITFIDQAYEYKTVLFLQSELPMIEQLIELQGQMNDAYDERFALNRTISRLKEMNGVNWGLKGTV